MISFNKILDIVMGLPPGDRDILLEILRNRRVEERRKEIANEVRESVELYKSGKILRQSADEVIQELNSISEDNKEH